MMLDGRREDPAREPQAVKVEHARAVDDIADLRPVDQVRTVEDRDAGKVAEGRVHKVVVAADLGDGGVGIEAGEDRVEIRVFAERRALEDLVAARILEPVDPCDGCRLCFRCRWRPGLLCRRRPAGRKAKQRAARQKHGSQART